MSNYTKKCKKCRGLGCDVCEHTGIQLYTEVEEDYDNLVQITGDKIYPDDPNYLDIEEDDYEV